MPVDVIVPPLSATADTLTLIEWYKREGDAVLKGEPLFMVETDKATLDVESPASGTLANVSAQAGETVATLSRIALLIADGEAGADANFAPSVAKKGGETPQPPPDERQKTAVEPPKMAVATPKIAVTPPTFRGARRVFISPRAKTLAQESRFDWKRVVGTGPKGAIVERDIRAALAQPQAPITLATETDATELVALFNRLEAMGAIVSYDDLLLLILARALRETPEANPSKEGVHISITAESEDDLRLAVVCDVDKKGLREIAKETLSLRAAALAGSLSPSPCVAALALTNLGTFGIDAFTPVVAPDCPLVGAGRIKALTQPSDALQRYSMWISLTFDPRQIRAVAGARFLQTVAETIENPIAALV